MPQEWTDALNAAVAAGKIPSYAPSTSTGGNPTYADGLDPTGSEVCSGTYKCRIDGQIWDAPDGTVGISFDDGPVDVSTFLCLGVELISGVIWRACADLVFVLTFIGISYAIPIYAGESDQGNGMCDIIR